MQLFVRIFNLLALLCLFIFPQSAHAQKTLRQKMADEFCVELGKQDFSKVESDKLMEKIGLAILPVVGKYKDEIKKELNLDMTSQEDFQKVGEIIGSEAVLSCPKFKDVMTNLTSGPKQAVKMVTKVNGTYLGVGASGNFAYLRVKGADGRENKLWWLQYFPGSDELNSFKDKMVSVSVVEEEYYEPTLKDYVKIKVVQSISLK